MSGRDVEIRTCSTSLLNIGTCCEDSCDNQATMATIGADLVEHARCLRHTVGAVASKPLLVSQEWT